MNNFTLFGLITVQLLAKTAFSAAPSSSLPIVDLGYAVHQATVNVCVQNCMSSILVLTCSRIQHTLTTISVTSDLAHPLLETCVSHIPFLQIQSIAQSMMVNKHKTVCRHIQVRSFLYAAWSLLNSSGWLVTAGKFLNGTPVATLANQTSSAKLNLSSFLPIDPQTSEDCLFLDVLVPQKIFESSCGKESRDNFRPGIGSRSNTGGMLKFNPALKYTNCILNSH